VICIPATDWHFFSSPFNPINCVTIASISQTIEAGEWISSLIPKILSYYLPLSLGLWQKKTSDNLATWTIHYLTAISTLPPEKLCVGSQSNRQHQLGFDYDSPEFRVRPFWQHYRLRS
jgi:hypothetical protein